MLSRFDHEKSFITLEQDLKQSSYDNERTILNAQIELKNYDWDRTQLNNDVLSHLSTLPHLHLQAKIILDLIL